MKSHLATAGISLQSLSIVLPIIALFLLFLSLSTLFVDAKKEVRSAAPVKAAIPHIRCSLCEHAMFQIVRNTLDYISDSGTKHKLREERLLDHVMEPVCMPFTPGGSWLRGADWDVVEKGPTNNATLRFRLRERGTSNSGEEEESATGARAAAAVAEERKTDYQCGERCATAAAACEELIVEHSDNADKITSVLVKSFKPLLDSLTVPPTEENDHGGEEDDAPIQIAKALVGRVCKNSKRWRRCPSKKASSSSSSSSLSVAILNAPPLIPMASKEVEVEEMMFRMKNGLKGKPSNKERDNDDDDKSSAGGGAAGNPGLDVYSRDEMMDMREALRTGDREKLMQLDPQSQDLSDEEFATLAEMHRQEFGESNQKKRQSGKKRRQD